MPLHSSHVAPPSRPARLRRLVLALALLCLSVLGRAASANTLNVPSSAYPTIQAAINAAVSGDTVLIADGTYTGPGDVDLDFGGRNITVTSQNGAARTIIDCGGFSSGDGSGDHRGFLLHSGEASVVIRGLTVRNGYESGNNGNDGNGGGIEVLSNLSAVTVQSCVLQNDTAAYYGGGLYNDTGTVGLTDCTLEGDTAGYYGGGLYNDGGTVGLTDCTLEGDTAGYYGGGLFNFGTVGLTDCALTGNTSRNYGGGVFNYGTVGLTDCTLTGNTAPNGGGLYTGGGTATLTNDILTGDTGGELSLSGGTASASHCDIAGGVPSGVTDNGGNLSGDPRFVNPPGDPQFAPPAVGDVHLRPDSPCLGAGTASGAPATDKDGTARPNPPSIGAYELGSTLTVALDGSAQYGTIQAAISAANPGNTVLIADGTYTGPGDVDLDFGGRNITVTSQNGAASTVIDCGGFASNDGSGDHRGFRLHSGEAGAVISGLTIQNGYENGSGSDGRGGGIEIGDFQGGGASVTVQDCVLLHDTATYGGGLYNGSGTSTLTGCALTGNTATYGGGLYSQGTVAVTDCALTGDTAYFAGGGLFNYHGSTATLTNDTLTGDTAPNRGGGLYNGGTAGLTNDVLYGDAGGEVHNTGTASATNCDVGEALGSGGDGVSDGGGNLDADPMFASASDLHLLPVSPCRGAGTSSGAPTTTLDGYTRPSPPSIGAYELSPPAATTTTLTSSLNPSTAGQSVTFTATVAGSVGTPTGSVTFTVDGSAQTPVTVDGNGNATFTTSALSAGQHTLTAVYGGDAANAPSASDTLTQTVKSATAVTLRNATGSAGQTVNLYAALATTGGVVLPGETVVFSIDGNPVASGLTNNGGVRITAYTLPGSLALGGHTLTAAFAGDTNNAPASGTAGLIVVLPSVKVAVSAILGSPGQTVTLRAGLHRAVGGAAVAGESVTFSVDGATVGTAVTNATGQAALPYVLPAGEAAGAHPITVAFAGDSSYTAASGTNTLTVKSATVLSVPSVSGQRGTGVTLSAVLTAGGSALSGKTVTFQVDGKSVGTAVTDGTGTASLSYAIPAASKVGHHAVSASFAGDAGDAPAAGAGTLTVR